MMLTGSWKRLQPLCLAALCDLFGQLFQRIGLLYVDMIVYQVLRGGMLLFTAGFRRTMLGHRTTPTENVGIAVIMVGLALTGMVACYGKQREDREDLGVWWRFFGTVMMLFGNAIISFQTVLEEKLMKTDETPVSPLVLVGIEGLVGVLWTSMFCLPVAQMLPGEEGHGGHEDTVSTVRMLITSSVLQAVTIAYFIAIFAWNIAGMEICRMSSATTRHVLSQVRTAATWVAALMLYYSGLLPQYGEPWQGLESWGKLFGFGILVLGVLIYLNPDPRSGVRTGDPRAQSLLEENDKTV
mmetsp:Transcript_45687/g.104341  ORF Transcript_45687/g.104341 Transcript_45687/m.104341 type:complete len:297 (+) Transcript_45687:2-892(+)